MRNVSPTYTSACTSAADPLITLITIIVTLSLSLCVDLLSHFPAGGAKALVAGAQGDTPGVSSATAEPRRASDRHVDKRRDEPPKRDRAESSGPSDRSPALGSTQRALSTGNKSAWLAALGGITARQSLSHGSRHGADCLPRPFRPELSQDPGGPKRFFHGQNGCRLPALLICHRLRVPPYETRDMRFAFSSPLPCPRDLFDGRRLLIFRCSALHLSC